MPAGAQGHARIQDRWPCATGMVVVYARERARVCACVHACGYETRGPMHAKCSQSSGPLWLYPASFCWLSRILLLVIPHPFAGYPASFCWLSRILLLVIPHPYAAAVLPCAAALQLEACSPAAAAAAAATATAAPTLKRTLAL